MDTTLAVIECHMRNPNNAISQNPDHAPAVMDDDSTASCRTFIRNHTYALPVLAYPVQTLCKSKHIASALQLERHTPRKDKTKPLSVI